MKTANEEAKIAKELKIAPWRVCLVGSTLIFGKGNDQDFLCLVDEETVAALGFTPDAELSYESPLRSFRRGNLNIIATSEECFFFAEMAIAHAAKQVAASASLDMADREKRIEFHSEIRGYILARLACRDFDLSEVFK